MEITNAFWDFIEEYLPGYYQREDVLRHSNLQLLVDGHESAITGLSKEEAGEELNKLTDGFCREAIGAYMETRKVPG
ncbi:hypothetical protein IR083_18290 [Dysgonomonas sp. GY75]|uniref:hypothetical protein n=1 Tax=Dysgonomonas sp. GY75 TaxID=2780419 RepID=UPI001883DDE1|nr:hypothetical protein [Dysgonomonas sp. GY75]MBF0650775.1 hypothetical protein [Dysgonomonas sp. GY75]